MINTSKDNKGIDEMNQLPENTIAVVYTRKQTNIVAHAIDQDNNVLAIMFGNEIMLDDIVKTCKRNHIIAPIYRSKLS